MSRTYARKTLSALHLKQRRTLACRGAISYIGHFLDSQRKEVLRKASMLGIEKGEIPFLPVIPFTHRSFHDQMPMIEIAGKKGQNNTCQDACITEYTPYLHRRPWYIFRVDIGMPLGGRSIAEEIERLRTLGRRPLLTEEVIGLCVHASPENVSLFCSTPHSNPWSQDHLITGVGPRDGLDGGQNIEGPTVFGLMGNLDTPRQDLRIPSCIQ